MNIFKKTALALQHTLCLKQGLYIMYMYICNNLNCNLEKILFVDA